jgi:hypothetical protein
MQRKEGLHLIDLGGAQKALAQWRHSEIYERITQGRLAEPAGEGMLDGALGGAELVSRFVRSHIGFPGRCNFVRASGLARISVVLSTNAASAVNLIGCSKPCVKAGDRRQAGSIRHRHEEVGTLEVQACTVAQVTGIRRPN